MSNGVPFVSRSMDVGSPDELVGLIYPLYASANRFAREQGFVGADPKGDAPTTYRLTLEFVR